MPKLDRKDPFIESILSNVKLMKSELLVKPLSLVELHAMACAFGEVCFKERGAAPFLWMIMDDKAMMWVETNWENPTQKGIMTHLMRAMMKELQITAYSFISEAWATSSITFPEEQREALQKQAQEQGLEDFPVAYRDDILMINSHDKAGNSLLSNYKVTMTQRPNQLNFLGPRIDKQDEFSDGGKLSGRMWNLLQEQQEDKQ